MDTKKYTVKTVKTYAKLIDIYSKSCIINSRYSNYCINTLLKGFELWQTITRS